MITRRDNNTMKKQRRFLAMLLTLAMTLGVSVGAFAAGGPPDMMGPGGDMDMMGGPGGPGGPGGGPAVDYGATHMDALADKDDVANKDAVSMLMSLGLVNGSKSGEVYLFNASASLKRAEAAKMVAQAAVLGQKENTGVQVAPTGVATFEDVVDHWAKDYIAYCADNGILDGTNGKFDPAGTVSADDLGAMLQAALGNNGGAAGSGAVTRDDAAKYIADALTGSGKVQYVTENQEGSITISGIVAAPAGKLVTLLVDGVETEIKDGTYENARLVVTDVLTTEKYGQFGSFGGGDKPEDYRFRAGAYVTEAGLQESKSVKDALTGAVFTEDGVSGINMKSTSDNFNSIIVDGKVNYTIKDSVFNIESESDGSAVNDFSGYGAVIGAYNGARVFLDNVEINTSGVARLSSFTDENAATVFENSRIKVMGGTLYEGYKNSANQATMVAPPWVLGITGNARGTNLEGNCSTTAIINSDMKANQWGVVSTDAGMNMQLFLVDSDLTLLGEGQTGDPFSTNYGSGYGTYAIGSAQEFFHGVNFNVGTYATIITGGYVHCSSSNGEFNIYPLSTEAEKHQFADLEGAQAAATGFDTANPIKTGIVGQGRITTINSDAFGFMSHGKAVIDITDGTVINTNNAVFVQRVGDALINVDGQSQLNVKDGIILQVMDNDDSLVGMGDMSTMSFNTVFKEDAGWHEGNTAEAVAGTAPVVFNASDVTLTGNLYNGSGNYNLPAGPGGNGGYSGIPMEINLGKDAVLNGAIASTAVMHIDENGEQVTEFTIDQYYYLCHLAHKNHFNGVNTSKVTLTDNAVWNVTGESLIQELTVGEGCTLNGDVFVDGAKTEIEAGKTYTGSIVVTVTGEQPSADGIELDENGLPKPPVDENGNPIAPPDGPKPGDPPQQ